MSGIYHSANEGLLERSVTALPKPERTRNIDIIADKLSGKDQKSKNQESADREERTQQAYSDRQFEARLSEPGNNIESDFPTRGLNMLQYPNHAEHRSFTNRRQSEEEFHHFRRRSPEALHMDLQLGIPQSFSPEHQSEFDDGSKKRRRYEDEASELEDLEQFAKDFKQKRIKMGFTQGDVGIAMGKFYGNDFSQTTISRFEALNLSVKNMCKLKPLLERWLIDVDRAISTGERGEGRMALTQPIMSLPQQQCLSRKRKKRTSIPSEGKLRLEDAFIKNPKPTSEEICKFSEDLKMDREVVRVWFCNRRQKQKRIATQQDRYVGDDPRSPSSPGFNATPSVEGQASPVSSEDEYVSQQHYDMPDNNHNLSKVPSALGQSVMGISLNQHPPRPEIIQMKFADKFSSPFSPPQRYSTHSNLTMGGNPTT